MARQDLTHIAKYILNNIKCTALLLILFPCSQVGNSQTLKGIFWNYTANDGLPSNEVYHIHQDADGYMWFATSNGVSRYDGYEFINFSINEGISDGDIFQIEGGEDGTLYLYGISGNVYEGNAEGFNVYRHQHLIDSFANAWTKGENNQNYISYPFGYIRIGDDEILHYTQQGIHLQISSQGHLKASTNESIYISINDMGRFLLTVNPAIKKNRDYRDSLKVKHGKQLFKIIHKDTTYLTIYTDKGWAFSRSTISKWNAIKYENAYVLWHDQRIYNISKDSVSWSSELFKDVEVIKEINGYIFTGQLNKIGAKIFKNLSDLKQNKYKSFLSGHSISYIHLDRKKDLWVSTTNSGVFRIPFNTLINEHVFDFDEAQSVKIITSNKKDSLFILTQQEQILGLSIPDGGKKTFMAESKGRVKDIQYDTLHKSIWYTDITLQGITPLGRISIYAKDDPDENFSFSKWTTKKSAGGNQCYIHYQDNSIWVTGADGFSKYHIPTQTLKLRKWTLYNNSVLRIYSILPENKNLVWLGTHSGVFIYNNDDYRKSTDSILAQEVPVTNIINSEYGKFFGTEGLGVYQHQSSFTRAITTQDGLSSNNIDALIKVGKNEIWVGSTNGLDRLVFENATDFQITHYSVANGLPSNSVSDMEYCNGKIYVATPEGLGVINPESNESMSPVTPIISQLIVNGEKYTTQASTKLKNKQSSVIIKYDCLDYRQLGKILYRYRTKNDEPWQVTNERSINFPRLSPGQYDFEVQAQGADRSWSESTHLTFSIASPYWRKLWFWASLVAFIFLAGYFYSRSKIAEARRETEIQKRIHDLERSALRAQMNPHFIFNVLQSIQSYIADGDSAHATRFVSKFARLIRSTLNSTRTSRITLENEITYLKEYLDLENMRLNNRLTYAFHVPNDLEAGEIEIPPMLIQPFLENSIKHGISPRPGPGNIELSFKLEKDHLIVTITDDGIGIEFSKTQKSQQSEINRSLGVEITQARLSALAKDDTHLYVSVEEIKDEAGNVKGTRALLTIRLHED